MPALVAALTPADVDYLYFVSRNDGSHAFSRTLQEHNRAVESFRRAARRRKGSRSYSSASPIGTFLIPSSAPRGVLLLPFVLLLALHAELGEWQHLQARPWDLHSALVALAVDAILDPVERVVDLVQLPLLAVGQDHVQLARPLLGNGIEDVADVLRPTSVVAFERRPISWTSSSASSPACP